jgi:hypothetical protein
MRTLALALTVSTLALGACTDGEPIMEDETHGDVGDVVGSYAAVTPIELQQAVANLPALGPVLVELRTVNENAGEAVLDALQAADVGSLSTLLKTLPSGLRADLVTRANVFLDPVKGEIAMLAGQLEELVSKVEIHSEIQIKSRQKVTGITDEVHQIRRVVFTAGGKQASVDVADLIDEGHGRISGDGKASLDSAAFSLAVGPLAMKAAAEVVFPQFGATDLNGALNEVIDCDQLGTAIEQVVSFVDAKAKCREALTNLSAKITMAAQEAKDELSIEIGDASGTISNGAIAGTWTWSIKLGGFEKELPLKFQARKQ